MHEFKIGDKVRLVDADRCHVSGGFKNGDIFTITKVDSNFVSDGGMVYTEEYPDGKGIYGRRFEFVESPKFSVGDKVKCSKGGYSFTLGNTYTISKVYNEGSSLRLDFELDDKESTSNGWGAEWFEPTKSSSSQNWTTRHLNPNPSSSKACTCDLVSVLMIQGCQCKAI